MSEPGTADDVLVGERKFERTLLIAFMNEQYEAAREHLVARRQMLAFLFAAATALALEGLKDDYSSLQRMALSGVIVAIGIYTAISNATHHRANRMHVETATACRKLLVGIHNGKGQFSDPIEIRKAVEKLVTWKKTNVDFEDVHRLLTGLPPQSEKAQIPKVGNLVTAVISAIPILIILVGVALGISQVAVNVK